MIFSIVSMKPAKSSSEIGFCSTMIGYWPGPLPGMVITPFLIWELML